MNLSTENIILIGSILLVASILANKASFKLGIPTLILFLVVGMLAGSEGIGKIYFDDPHTAQILGIVALNFILFSGGMDTKWESVKPIIWRGVSLSTLGVLITATVVGIFVHLVFDFTLLEGLLLGSIVSATDAAAVFSILRSRNIGLKGSLRPILELESGSNDPMAYILTISLTYLLTSGDASIITLLLHFVQEMTIGAVAGYALGRFMTFIINRIKLDTEGLYPVLVMAMIFFTYSFTDVIGGNGFLAVYLSALVFGNSSFLHKKSLIRFYDGQAWLMQIVMFLTLGLLVFPSRIIPVIDTGLLISAVLIFLARPVAVFLSLSFFKMKIRHKLFISWVGLRGSVPIVFAIYPMIAGVAKADMIFHLVFFISVTSVLIQGTTLPLVAKWLRLSVPQKIKRKTVLDLELSDTIKSELIELLIPPGSNAIGRSIVKLQLHKDAMIVLLSRNGKYIQPGGATKLEAEDKLLVLASNKEVLKEVKESLGISDSHGDNLMQS
ncbi:MAG TPA: potassium/proton antiporter [Chitinophagaceae bacterium]|jgi:cell volume regulation protein A|nr:potassium/proton antiporter [Chitinophagaceae bacterium]